jgi:hypothetical protein
LFGIAVKATLVPEQIEVADADMLTLAGRFGLTVIVMALEVAGLPETHVALEVITHVITSLLARELLV